MLPKPSGRRGSPRPTSSARWSANSPSCKESWASTTPRPRDLLEIEKTAARMVSDVLHRWAERFAGRSSDDHSAEHPREVQPVATELARDLLVFFADRLKIYLRER